MRPSNIKSALTYTQRKQVILSFIPELYFKNEEIFLAGFYTYYKYPDKFWGIGNNAPDAAEEDYTPDYLRTFTNILKRVKPGLYVGLRYQFEYISLKKTEASGVLARKTIPGSENGSASGLGMMFTYDTRNNIYFPTSGHFHQVYAVYFGDALGSDYKFNLYNFDIRGYYAIAPQHVLAFQSLNTVIVGEPPFQMMALLGGSYWMRGYYFGRYRDKNMLTFQAEYRFPLFWRFGGVAFGGAGDVASDVKKFHAADFKLTAGFGLRFMFDRQERINARLDVGIRPGWKFRRVRNGDRGVLKVPERLLLYAGTEKLLDFETRNSYH